MLEQILAGLGRTARKQFAEASHLSDDEIADVRQVSVNGIGASGQKLVGKFPQRRFAHLDRFDEEGRRPCLRGQSPPAAAAPF
jgi:hypothetical protein